MIKPDTPASRILLIDDHPAVLKGLRLLLATLDHEVCAEAQGLTEALEILDREDFDIALLDLTLRDGSGLTLLPELEMRDVSALVYTMHEDPEIVGRAMRNGALGYVSKQEDPDVLFEALEQVSAGKRYVSPCVQKILEQAATEDTGRGPEQCLSDREMQVFVFIGKGFGITEIAEKLGLSRRTVETYCTRMIKKMDFNDRSELRKYAVSLA